QDRLRSHVVELCWISQGWRTERCRTMNSMLGRSTQRSAPSRGRSTIVTLHGRHEALFVDPTNGTLARAGVYRCAVVTRARAAPIRKHPRTQEARVSRLRPRFRRSLTVVVVM